jgi:arylsulfatase A-like enzyme
MEPHDTYLTPFRFIRRFGEIDLEEMAGYPDALNVVIRQNQWKAIWNHEIESMELYDLDRDPGEHLNIALERPELQQALSVKARDWLRDCEAVVKQPEDIVDVDEEIEEKLRALGYFH